MSLPCGSCINQQMSAFFHPRGKACTLSCLSSGAAAVQANHCILSGRHGTAYTLDNICQLPRSMLTLVHASAVGR
jgi:hypothetical protein